MVGYWIRLALHPIQDRNADCFYAFFHFLRFCFSRLLWQSIGIAAIYQFCQPCPLFFLLTKSRLEFFKNKKIPPSENRPTFSARK